MDDFSTDTMQGTAPSAPSPAVPTMNYAGFWIRLMALFIDFALLMVVMGAIVTFFFGGLEAGSEAFSSPLIPLLYYVWMEGSSKQATLGKMAMGLRVTDTSGLRISYPRALGRYFAKIISVIPLFIGFFMVAFTAKKQGLHDMIAGTLVVKGR